MHYIALMRIPAIDKKSDKPLTNPIAEREARERGNIENMPASQRTPRKFRQVVMDFVETGNKTRVAERHNLTPTAIRKWQERWPDEWHQIELETLAAISSETLANFRQVIHKGTTEALDRLDKGEVIGIDSEGNAITQRVRAKDAFIIAATAFDKVRLIEGKATRIIGDSSKVALLMEQFRAMGESYRTGRVIEALPVEPESKSGA